MKENWLHTLTRDQRHVLFGSFAAWAIDAMDLLLYVMAIVVIMKEFAIDTTTAGMLTSVMLVSSALGGTAAGVIADRWGRKPALLASIFTYCAATALCAAAASVTELAIYRTILGLGIGGAWSAAAALVNETCPSRHRGKASAVMQSGYSPGFMLASGLAMVLLPAYGWRVFFLAGTIPGVLVFFYILNYVKESPMWLESKRQSQIGRAASHRFVEIFKGEILRITVLASLFVTFIMLGYWALIGWLPTFLSTPIDQGGAGMSIVKSAGWIFAMQFGSFAGYLTFGCLADKIGRKKSFIIYLAAVAILTPVYGSLRDETMLLLLGPVIGFFGLGYFSGFGAMLSELFPTRMRGAGMGFTFNFGRAMSAFAPVIVGMLAKTYGIGPSLLVSSVFIIMGICTLLFLPETKGVDLEDASSVRQSA